VQKQALCIDLCPDKQYPTWFISSVLKKEGWMCREEAGYESFVLQGR
jgi:hypothetical protein